MPLHTGNLPTTLMTTQTAESTASAEAIEQRDADRIIFSDKELQTFSRTAAELARKAAQRVVLKTAIWKVAADLEIALVHLSYEEVASELSTSIKATVKPKTLRRYMKAWRDEQSAIAQSALIEAESSADSLALPNPELTSTASSPTDDSVPSELETAPATVSASELESVGSSDDNLTQSEAQPTADQSALRESQSQPPSESQRNPVDPIINIGGSRTIRRTIPPFSAEQSESVQLEPATAN